MFSWGIIQLLNWLVNEYVLSPYLPDFGLAASLSLMPTILMLTYFHGKAGLHPWTKVEKIGIPLNLVAAVVVMFVIFQGKDLGAATKTVIVEDEEGVKIERVIPKSEFRKKIALFFFDNESGDSTLNWLQYGLSEMLILDLIQDIFVEVRYAYEGSQSTFYMKMKKAGFAEGIGLPLTLKREIAHDLHLDYFIVGSFKEENDIFTIETVLYKTESGKPIADNAYEGTDVFELVDAISVKLKHDLEIPDRHIAEVTDLPVSEMLTDSINAFRSYIAGKNAAIFDNDWNRSVEHMENAVRLDPTFSYAYFFLQEGYMLTNQGQKREEAFGPLMQHLYKLPERVRYLVKVVYYDFKEDPDKQFGVAKMMVDLYPDDIMGHQLLSMLYMIRGQRDEVVSELKRILELDPEQYEVLQQIGSIHKDKGEFEEALKYYKEYADHFPEDYKSFAAIGGLYKTLGNYEEAKSYYDKALIIEPTEVSVLITLADIQRRLGNFEGALKQYEAALIVSKIAQDSVSLYAAFESFYEEKGEINKALEYNDLRLAMTEKIAPPAAVLLQKLQSLGKYIKAGRDEVAFQTIGTLEAQLGPPFNMFVPLGYLDIYLELGDADNAEKAIVGVETLIQAFQLEILRPWVLHALGKIHEVRGEYEEAIVSYEKQRELEPTNTKINRGIGRCYRNIGELEKAKEYLNKALKIYPFEPLNNYEIALVYSEMGKREEALEYLRIALEVWKDADQAYKPAKRALDKLTEWESTS
ncbi:MAG: tetratricopeptide repeat protein [Candidatus Marinimicrobia bacterium]|nr:tetratricopeptide repeat protein [Candidatus Neomarinimicrobiota bacterium]